MTTREPSDSFTVGLRELRRVPGSAQHVERRGRVGLLRVVSQAVPADAVTDVDVTLEATDGGVMVTGSVSAPWEGECRRCLAPITGHLEVDVRELYRPRRAGEEDDEETYPLSGDKLDLRPLARDALLLSLPLAPLCRPDCAGLCATCGADLNDGPCGCPPPGRDPRWAGLDSLRQP